MLRTTRDATYIDLHAQRDQLIGKYNTGRSTDESRALVLRALTENVALSRSLYNHSVVLMEYFGYLGRDPDQPGYDFWLNVLDNRDAGNYRGMICSFLTSAEYQRRFSPIVTRSNAECAH